MVFQNMPKTGATKKPKCSFDGFKQLNRNFNQKNKPMLWCIWGPPRSKFKQCNDNFADKSLAMLLTKPRKIRHFLKVRLQINILFTTYKKSFI